MNEGHDWPLGSKLIVQKASAKDPSKSAIQSKSKSPQPSTDVTIGAYARLSTNILLTKTGTAIRDNRSTNWLGRP
ncbi:MAG: hypothetical protein SGI77_08395 [Pirellulaceae bacterium]|nr:hypothetical protein [Pirellulaceae bacterium]